MQVVELTECHFEFDLQPWPFAVRNAPAIDRHWQLRTRQNPRLFDGTVLMIDALSIEAARLTATLRPVAFAAHLFWREHAGPDRSVTGNFGGSAIWPADGGLLTVRAGAGTLHAGRLHLPGGFLDLSDVVTRDGVAIVDVDHQIMRELSEELGFTAEDLHGIDRYWAVLGATEVGIIADCRSRLAAEQIRHRHRAHETSVGDGEVSETVVVHRCEDFGDDVVPYLDALAASLLE